VRGGFGACGQKPKLDKISSRSLNSTVSEPSRSSGQSEHGPYNGEQLEQIAEVNIANYSMSQHKTNLANSTPNQS